MATKYWIGNDSGNEGDWATAANWYGGVAPVDGDLVVMDERAAYAITGSDQTATELIGFIQI